MRGVCFRSHACRSNGIAQRCGFGSEETMRRSFLRLPSGHAARLPFSLTSEPI